jgi:hypothetical protein
VVLSGGSRISTAFRGDAVTAAARLLCGLADAAELGGVRWTIAIVETIGDGVRGVTQRMLGFFIQGVEHELAHLLDMSGGCPGEEYLAVVGEGHDGNAAVGRLGLSLHQPSLLQSS